MFVPFWPDQRCCFCIAARLVCSSIWAHLIDDPWISQERMLRWILHPALVLSCSLASLVSILHCREEIPSSLGSHISLGCSWRTAWFNFQLEQCTWSHRHLHFLLWLNLPQTTQPLSPEPRGMFGFTLIKTLVISHTSRTNLKYYCSFLPRCYQGLRRDTKPAGVTTDPDQALSIPSVTVTKQKLCYFSSL